MARPGLFRHPKFKHLCRMLRMPEAHVLGHLEMLWQSAYEVGPVIGDAEHIEAAAGWVGDQGILTAALLGCGKQGGFGFIEARPDGQFCIHDLNDHAPKYVGRRFERENERKQSGKTISDIRREAAGKRWGKTEKMQKNANGMHSHTLPLKKEKERDAKPDAKPDGENEPFRLARLLYDLVQSHGHNLYPREPNWSSWTKQVELLIRRDGRRPEEVEKVIRWCQSDNFWHTVILSPESLRRSWPKAVAQMMRQAPKVEKQKPYRPPAKIEPPPDAPDVAEVMATINALTGRRTVDDQFKHEDERREFLRKQAEGMK